MEYDFQLEKYRGSNSRFTCPNCRKSKQFVRYIDKFGEYLSPDVGKCNRENNCGYHLKPKEFFQLNPTFSPKRIMTSNRKPIVEKSQIKTFSRIDEVILKKTLRVYERNTFVRFLKQIFPLKTVQYLIDCYRLGTWGNGACVFWQIDETHSIRSGKIISYDQAGHRNGYLSWVHSELLKRKLVSEFELEQCLFGEHLVKANSKIQSVAIVESEKTAVICQAFWQNIIFLACGGLQNLTASRLQSVKDKKILLFPDSDGFEKWKQKANDLSRKGFNVKMSDLIERMEDKEKKKEGYDLADYLINQRKKTNTNFST